MLHVADEDKDEIHTLWDELADFDVAQSEVSNIRLMRALADQANVWNVTWAGAVRLTSGERAASDDVMRRWRVAAVQSLHTPIPPPHRIFEQRENDPSMDIPLRDLGRFRHYTFRRELPPAWFESAFYRQNYGEHGIVDAAFVAFPVNDSCESHFGFWAREPLTERAVALVAYALRGIKWFHRRLMLSHGLLLANAPLTPTERKVLHLLLTNVDEKQIAEQLGLAASTTHHHILAIFRKFGVRSRSALIGLWLNRPITRKAEPNLTAPI